jgi:membrane protease YdiL (CAAX protease family)
MAAAGVHFYQWASLAAVIAATVFTVRVVERGRWRLGLFVAPRIAAIDFGRGTIFTVLLIGGADVAILATTNLRHIRSDGFPWLELIAVFAPAVFHEELLFRGYLFQKIRIWNRYAAIGATSAVFAMLHGFNHGITAVAMVNLTIAGVLLALAYERYQRLWFPIGIHLAWNLLSGPILGYGVSGYVAQTTLFRTIGSGPALLTGGAFGIEGSIWMAAVELGGIFWLSRGFRKDA